MKIADRISAGILIGLCIVFQIKMEKFNPLSRLFPQVIILIVGGLALLLLLLSFIKPKNTIIFEKDTSYLLPVVSVVIMAVWVLCIGLIGFLFSSIIFFPLTGILITIGKVEKRQIIKNCIIAVALIAVFFLLFSLFLNVQFPTGKLGII